MMKIEGLPVIDVDESEKITVAVRADDLLEGDTADPERHPIAIDLRRQDNVDDARVTKNETLVRRGKSWFRYDALDKRLFMQLQKTLMASPDECIAQSARTGITFQALAPRHRTCFRPSVQRL